MQQANEENAQASEDILVRVNELLSVVNDMSNEVGDGPFEGEDAGNEDGIELF